MFAGPFIAACALLVIAGVGKVLHAGPARLAARAAGIPVSAFAITLFGVVEMVAGGAGIVFGGRAALVVAACYGALTVVAVLLLVRAPSTPCACLGSSGAVVTRTHVVVDVAAAGVAVVAATGGAPLSVVDGNWLAAATFAVLVACCVKLAVLTLDLLPAVGAASREGAA